MIVKADHTALSVVDMDKSLAFYRDIIGFEVVRTLQCGPETLLGEVVGMQGCSAKIAHLKLGGTMLELFQYTDPCGRAMPADSKQADKGWIHMGFTSDDVRGDAERLKAAGIELVSEPVEFRPDVWIVYLRGPDGEVCELRQTPPGD